LRQEHDNQTLLNGCVYFGFAFYYAFINHALELRGV
jgi:hypothetical protein